MQHDKHAKLISQIWIAASVNCRLHKCILAWWWPANIETFCNNKILLHLVLSTVISFVISCNQLQLRSRLRLKCDGTSAETTFRLSAKRTSPFKTAGASVQSTTGSRSVRISGSIAGYTMFRGSVKSLGYPHHSPVSPSFPIPCVTVCHHVSTGLYLPTILVWRTRS
jgi:hypothetical protein